MQSSRAPNAEAIASGKPTPLWRKAIPYFGTILIFGLIFWRIPIAKVAASLRQIPVFEFIALFMPYSLFFFVIDAFCLAWVVRRFNAPMTFSEILPISASKYLLSLINTGIGQGGVAYYLHRKGGIAFLAALSSIFFIALMEVYQLFLFSTVGVVFYHAVEPRQARIVSVLRFVYVAAWLLLVLVMILFAAARRRAAIREWIEGSRLGAIAATFLRAHPLDYLTVLAIKAPSFLGSVIVQYFALSLYGISVPFLKLMMFLPLVFLSAALPISVAHLGTSQAAWLLFFSGNAPAERILAYSLAQPLLFMICNGLIGLAFLPRASRELTRIASESPQPSSNAAS
ncbi:MAG TPA: lysylphosphatidylglycerol synthase domain-containing protein [Candidatus Binataceae bacterium]